MPGNMQTGKRGGGVVPQGRSTGGKRVSTGGKKVGGKTIARKRRSTGDQGRGFFVSLHAFHTS